MHLTLALVVTLQAVAGAGADAQQAPARDPAISPTGAVAVEVYGDLLLGRLDGSWRRLTSGPAQDRSPTWLPDGDGIVFASDRAGGFDLWRLDVREGAAAAEPHRLTSTPEPELEPTVLADGRVVFVRGAGPDARLWVLEPDGRESPVTGAERVERSPAAAPAGARVVYIIERDGRPELRIRDLDDGTDRRVDVDRSPERPAWSPDGERLAFATVAGEPGVWVTTPDARYVNLVSPRRAAPAWLPDGDRMVLAALPRREPGYNGDPMRLGDRAAHDLFPDVSGLWLVDVPPAPDAGLRALAVDGTARAERNAAVLERVAERLSRLYYAGEGAGERRRAWRRLVDERRAEILAAADEAALGSALHALIAARPPAREPARGRAAVSSAHPLATEAGLEILRMGGNVVDAAVAVSFALGVVEPDASGVGGYGQMLVQLEGRERPALIEFMTRAPEAASLENAALLTADGDYPDGGPVLANVPGTVAGMWRAWQRFGSGALEWVELVEPAIRLARDGFPVSEGFATTLATEREHYLRYDGPRALFFPGGEPLQAGDTLRNPDLAWTLTQIADGGADAFYRGPIARRMVEDLRGKGNAMTTTDVARYFAAERDPVGGTYRGHTVYSSAPPSAGGASLVAKLNLLEHLDGPELYRDDARTLHAMIEAWKLAPSARGRIADPGLWPVDVEAVTSRDSADARWHCFDPGRASLPAAEERNGQGQDGRDGRGGPDREAGEDRRHGQGGRDGVDCPPLAQLSAGPAHGNPECDETSPGHRRCHATGTTAFAVADADGNMVAVTQTLGTWGGNFYLTPGLGFIYNDKLRSYARERDDYNARLPYARHGSSISPTLIYRGTGADAEPLAALGAAGNAWITSAVYQMTAAIIDRGLGPQQALELPRFLVTRQTGEDGQRQTVIQIEDAFAPDALRELEARGHVLQPISLRGELRMGYGAAVMLRDGEAIAGGDPRRAGQGGGVK